MDETAAVNMALDAVQTLKGIDANVVQLRELLQAHIEQVPELVQPAQPEAQLLALDASESDGWTTAVTVSEPLPDSYAADLMHFQYMHFVVLVVIAVALLLNFGATLWLAFSRNWRS